MLNLVSKPCVGVCPLLRVNSSGAIRIHNDKAQRAERSGEKTKINLRSLILFALDELIICANTAILVLAAAFLLFGAILFRSMTIGCGPR